MVVPVGVPRATGSLLLGSKSRQQISTATSWSFLHTAVHSFAWPSAGSLPLGTDNVPNKLVLFHISRQERWSLTVSIGNIDACCLPDPTRSKRTWYQTAWGWHLWCYSGPRRRAWDQGIYHTLISTHPPPAAIDLLHPCWDKVLRLLHNFAQNSDSGSLFHAFPESTMLSAPSKRIWSQRECFCWCCFAPKQLSNPSFPTGFLLFWIGISVGVRPSSRVEGFSFNVEESLRIQS